MIGGEIVLLYVHTCLRHPITKVEDAVFVIKLVVMFKFLL